MKVILFSLLALTMTPALKADTDMDYWNSYDKRYNPEAPYTLVAKPANDTKFNIRMAPDIFEALVTEAINTPNVNTEPFAELLLRIQTGKISHNLSQQFTRITHKDFYYRLLPFIPFNRFFSLNWGNYPLGMVYLIKIKGKKASLDLNIWSNGDERIDYLHFDIDQN
jgi:hypothetical protein